MDLRAVAQGAPYCLATSLEECSLDRFWVVQLDCGFDVFQSVENASLDEPNAWMRLKQFCADHNVKITNMARASRDLNPHTQINFDPMADGYFYARRVRKLMCGNPLLNGYVDRAEGCGQLHKNVLKIVWEMESGGIDLETRDLDENPKSNIVSLIRK